MSNERIRLDKAIEANANGIKTLEHECERHVNEANKHNEKAETYRQEIYARRDMGSAMERLQAIYSQTNESIYFVIPNVG